MHLSYKRVGQYVKGITGEKDEQGESLGGGRELPREGKMTGGRGKKG